MADKVGKVVGILMTYNCARSVERTYRSIPKEHFDEIIVVDDESSDDTVEVARGLGLRVFTHPHTGYGGNLFVGFKEALKLGAAVMVELHGDGQYDFSPSPLAIEKMRKGCDLILGNRFHEWKQPLRDGMDWARYSGNIFLSTIGRFGLGIDTRDLFPGFRVYSRRFVENLDISRTSQDYFFSFEIIAQAKYCNLNIDKVPVRCDYKQEHSSMKLYKGFPAILHTCWTVILYRLACLGFRRGIFATFKRI